MARATTSRSCGSRCWSARAALAPRASSTASAGVRSRSPQARAQEAERLIERKIGAGGVAAVPVLELARLEPAIRHHHAMWNAEQLRVGELDARTCVAVVEQHLEAGGGELGVQAVGDRAHTVGFLQVEWHQHHLEG